MPRKSSKAQRVKLTVKRCGALVCPSGQTRVYYYDQQTPGLCLCVASSGTRTFYSYRWVKGPVRVRIGRFPDIGLDVARKEAHRIAGDIAMGKDPQEARRAAKGVPTFGDLWTHYFEKHAKLHKKTWQEDERQYNAHLAGWAKRKLPAIRKADVMSLHASIGENNGTYMANRVLQTVHAVFAMAKDLEWTGPNPAAGIKRFKEHKRDRFLQADEMPRFFKALEEEPSESIRDYLWLSLLTGARRGNVLAMRWEQVHFDSATWRIPDTKSGEPVKLPLGQTAIDILKRRKEQSNGSPWVFPGRGASKHLVEPKEAWAQLLARADIKDLRIHDLRRTFGSWQAAAGVSLAIIGKSLGHTSLSATAVYARLNLEPVRIAVETATAAILEAGKATPKS